MTATADVATVQAPPQADAPPAVVGPWTEAEVQRLVGHFPTFVTDKDGTWAVLSVPAAERAWWQGVRAASVELERPLEQARAATLNGEQVAEFKRRAEALRLARGQVAYFGLRLGELKAQRKAALAQGDEAGLASAEANLQHAQAELERFEGRAVALAPLVEQAQRLAADTLTAAVNAAHRGVVAAAMRERDRARHDLAEVTYRALPELLAAQARLEDVASRARAEELGQLPEERTGG
jgi:hypothetical protein